MEWVTSRAGTHAFIGSGLSIELICSLPRLSCRTLQAVGVATADFQYRIQLEGLQTAAQDNRRRRRQVKEAAVEKKVSGMPVISQKVDGIFAVAAVVYGHFLSWRKPGLGTADVSEKATVRKSEKSASHRPRTCQRNNCPRSFKANRNH